jgi:hypothetical protein
MHQLQPFPFSCETATKKNSSLISGEKKQRLSMCATKHFATLLDPVTVFIKLRSALHKQGAIMAPKHVDPFIPIEEADPPLSFR